MTQFWHSNSSSQIELSKLSTFGKLFSNSRLAIVFKVWHARLSKRQTRKPKVGCARIEHKSVASCLVCCCFCRVENCLRVAIVNKLRARLQSALATNRLAKLRNNEAKRRSVFSFSFDNETSLFEWIWRLNGALLGLQLSSVWFNSIQFRSILAKLLLAFYMRCKTLRYAYISKSLATWQFRLATKQKSWIQTRLYKRL